MSTLSTRIVGAAAVLALLSSASTLASDAGTPSAEQLSKLYPGKAYSPYAKRSFPSQVFWGETHLHTGLSLDAGLFGNTLRHDEAYRFARGEEVVSSTGLPVKLGRPLDWLVIADHSDMMGIATDIQQGTPNILAIPEGKRWHEAFQQGGQAAGQAAFELIQAFSQFTVPEKMVSDYSPGSAQYASIWEDIADAAERYNEPGHFTAFIGYEWTSVPKGFNLHRNVILRDGADRAKREANLRMDDKEQNFQLSSVTISKEVPTLAGFKNAAVISSKNDLHIFDQNYDLWRYQRDWQTILKVDLSTHGLKFDRKKAPAN